jgi:prevent-host-death family protein
MTTINVYAAKTQLSRLLDQVEKGDEVIITRSGRPIAKLTSLKRSRSPRKLGALKGRIRIGRDFDAPLPPEILDAFEGD